MRLGSSRVEGALPTRARRRRLRFGRTHTRTKGSGTSCRQLPAFHRRKIDAVPVVVAWKLRFSATVALTIAAEVAGVQEPRDVPTFPSRTELVTVDAVVLDEQGRPARGLTAQDFALA